MKTCSKMNNNVRPTYFSLYLYQILQPQTIQKLNINLEKINLTWSYHFLSGKKNKLRVYYLSWLRNKILHNDPEVEKKQGWTTVGDLEGCVHYKVGRLQVFTGYF